MANRYTPESVDDYAEKREHIQRIETRASQRLQPAFGGEFQPGLHAPTIAQKKLANPAPLGLGAFALTTFVLSAINLGANKVAAPNLVVALALGYGGLVQLLAGMWEMAVGNTFGATALSSYGGFWISFGVILTPAFGIVESYTDKAGVSHFDEAFSLYLWGWFIFTTILMLLTLRSTVAFCGLFVTLDLAFLFLALGTQYAGGPHAANFITAGGSFGMAAAALAFYNMMAGIADSSNFFFTLPVIHFPWSEKARSARSAEQQV